MSKAKQPVKFYRISNEEIKRFKKFQIIDFERFFQWIPVGSGNYEKTQDDGRYQPICNTYSLYAKIRKKRRYYHCGKADCTSCCITYISKNARELNERLMALIDHSAKHGIKLRILHASFKLRDEIAKIIFSDYYLWSKFRKRIFNPFLNKVGFFASIPIVHIWTSRCVHCGEREKTCKCGSTVMFRRVNIHVHVIGFGYLDYPQEMQKKYPEIIYRNAEKRDDGFNTLVYLLRKAGIWRKTSGKIMPSYTLLGYLNGHKIKKTGKEVVETGGSWKERQKFIQIKQDDGTFLEEPHGEPELVYVGGIRVKRGIYQLREIKKLQEIARNNRTKYRIHQQEREDQHEHFKKYMKSKNSRSLKDEDSTIIMKFLQRELNLNKEQEVSEKK